MIHDFTITPSALVLFVGPLQFDFDAMFSGGDMLAWKPELGLRIAVVERTGSHAVRWLDTEPFWVWHFANAFDRVTDAGTHRDRRRLHPRGPGPGSAPEIRSPARSAGPCSTRRPAPWRSTTTPTSRPSSPASTTG